MSNIDDITQITDVREAPGQCSPGDRQRLRIFVPNVKTTLSMGARAPGSSIRSEDNTGAPNYDGFGVHSVGHIFMTAAGPDAESTATLQAKGALVLQSENASSLLAAGDSAVVHAVKQAMINGGDGLFLASGVGATPPRNEESDGAVPSGVNWIDVISDGVRRVADFWANVDMYFAAVDLGIIAVDSWSGVRTGTMPKKALVWQAIQAILAEMGGGTRDVVMNGFNPYVRGKASGNTVIHGEGGLVLGSKMSAGLFSTIGTTVGSMTFAGVTAPFSSVVGLRDVEVRAATGSGSMVARKTLELSGANTSVAGLKGELGLYGKCIRIGDDPESQINPTSEAEPSGNQAKTVKLFAAADEQVRLASKRIELNARGQVTGGQYYSADPLGIQLLAENRIYTDSKDLVSRHTEGVHLSVADKFGLSVSKTKLSVGKLEGKEQHVGASAGPGITVDDQEIRHGVNGWGMRVTDGSTAIGDRANFVRVAGGKVTVKGSQLKIF